MRAAEPAASPPFVRHGGGASPPTPLVVAVPHAGRRYPAPLERLRAVRREVLEQLEDRHADLLIAPLLALGGAAVVARTARAWIDLNRAEHDGPSPVPSARERAGLGLVPTRLGGRPLWRIPPDAGDLAERIATVHRPYHAAIATALAAARAVHGHALLLDIHSMPPLGRGAEARVVLGDRHGASASAAVTAAALATLRAAGLAAATNTPYAGAYTLDRHGAPAGGVHALQVEVDRRLYLQPGLREPDAAGVARVRAWLAALAGAGMAALAAESLPIAAE